MVCVCVRVYVLEWVRGMGCMLSGCGAVGVVRWYNVYHLSLYEYLSNLTNL